MHHYYVKEVKGLSKEELSGVTQMFIKAYNLEPTSRITGALYSRILLMKNNSTDYIKQKWERELAS